VLLLKCCEGAAKKAAEDTRPDLGLSAHIIARAVEKAGLRATRSAVPVSLRRVSPSFLVAATRRRFVRAILRAETLSSAGPNLAFDADIAFLGGRPFFLRLSDSNFTRAFVAFIINEVQV
jgi:hypothetical protein